MSPLELPPGVVATPTKKMNSSNYLEANLVRWIEGSLTPVGGMERYAYTFESRCRKIHTWLSLAGVRYTAYLCEAHCYVESGGTLTDISPTVPLNPPSDDLTSGGYGDDTYSLSTYGTPRAGGGGVDTSKKIPEVYSADNWGEDLVVMTSPDGRYLKWKPTTPSVKLATVVGSPSGRFFTITPERFVIMFGLGGVFNHWGWCDQENDGDWNFASTVNKAGDYTMQPASPLICGMTGKYGTIFFTAKKAYVARFVGLPYVYSYEEVGEECTPWSPASIAGTQSQVMWMSEEGAYTFDGSTITPIACPIRDWITDDVDSVTVRLEAVATTIGQFSEFWWFFPQDGQRYNTRAVFYSFREGWWSQARMGRSAGMTGSYTSYPIMANNMKAYQHESGINYPDVSELPWIETFSLNMGKGGALMTFRQLLPDIEGDSSNLSIYLKANMSRSDKTAEYTVGPYKVRDGGFVDFDNETARDFRLRFQADGPDVPKFTLGQHQLDAVQRGMY